MAGPRKSEQELVCWKASTSLSLSPISHQKDGAQHGTGLQRGRQLLTFLHVSLTSLSSVQPLILFCVICYYCRRYRLDTDFDYVYGPEPLRTIVFKTPWRSSRSLLYNHSDMKWASRKPNPSFQTTFQFLSWLLLFCNSRYK